MKYKFAIIIFIILVFLINGCSQFLPRSCTLESKQCPNGRGVGRVGPNCEFAPCELPSNLNECDTKKEFWKNWCYLDYASEVAMEPGICEKISIDYLKDKCYYQISSSAKNILTCSQIKKFKEECVVQVSKISTDPNICDDLSEKRKAECYYSMGGHTMDHALCEKAKGFFIGDFEFRYLCLRDIAVNKNDSAFCDSLSKYGYNEDYYKRDCLAGFSTN